MAESKYVLFVVGEKGRRRTEVWKIISKSNNDLLGELRWHAPWRQYCFYPATYTVWSIGCLEDVLAFIMGMKTRREVRNSISPLEGKE